MKLPLVYKSDLSSRNKYKISKVLGMNITFVTSADTDEEGYALLREFGLPFKTDKNTK